MTLTTQTADGTRYQIKIAVDDGYLFTIQQSVTNASAQPLSVRPIGLVSRATQSADRSMWTNHVGPIGVFNGKVELQASTGRTSTRASAENFADNTGWLGFTDKYWLTAPCPAGQAPQRVPQEPKRRLPGGLCARTGDGRPRPDSHHKGPALCRGEGEGLLDRYEQAGIPLLSYAIDWGWFWFFARPIFDLLVILFHTVRELRPGDHLPDTHRAGRHVPDRAEAVPVDGRDAQAAAEDEGDPGAFKDDKPRQQQEILKLYQAEKVNPAAGCLPIVLQIPVFYALYKTLAVSVEMRHQPFVGWIRDLSAADPLTPMNLFGLLHFTPPAYLAIGILPILVGATQWVSMKLNPQPMDPAQAQVFAIMPWVLVFVMAPFAAGLQLYWITNNMLTIAQQWFLYRKFGLHLSDTHPVHT